MTVSEAMEAKRFQNFPAGLREVDGDYVVHVGEGIERPFEHFVLADAHATLVEEVKRLREVVKAAIEWLDNYDGEPLWTLSCLLDDALTTEAPHE